MAPVLHETRVVASEAEQLRLERYKMYHPPTFSGLASNDALGFLEKCHRILRTIGIVETSGVSFTAFHLSGATYQWWRAYELSSLDEATSLTWTQFSEMFLREYVPQSLRDAWRIEFEQLRQCVMTVLEYAVRFSELARDSPALVAIVTERVRRFNEGLHPSIRTSMARELEMDITYQQAVSIARRVEAASGVLAPPRPHEPYYAPPVSSMPPTRGAIIGQSSRSGLSQSQPPHPLRGYFECGDTRHMVRDCPRARRGAPPQTYQPLRAPPGPPTILPTLAATPPSQAARGGGRGRPRRGGQARYYALPARSEAVASDSVIIGIVPDCHRDASV
ncbi:uncharacterized protein [Nicotiana tomentosiformis]|uniref:uncharacterized protein n=1 Tax=Nicotiana tomentosiformis TaxID=4098 RepID=UPI00388C8267